MMNLTGYDVLDGDAITRLRGLPDGMFQECITSPPYWSLRSYLDADDPLKHQELGAEKVHDCLGWARGENCAVASWEDGCYVCHLRLVMGEVWRVLRDDATLWVVIGDSYASGKGTCFNPGGGENSLPSGAKESGGLPLDRGSVVTLREAGLKPKDLCMVPARVALALQADGWYLRSAITWCKGNPMPESVTDRPTTATEMVFLLTKAPEYFYDAFAIREAGAQPDRQRADRFGGANGHEVRHGLGAISEGHQTRNKLNWWRVNPGGSSWEYCRHCARLFEGPERGRIKKRVEKDGEGNERTVRYCPECGATDGWVDHFAAFPPALVEPMIRVGSSERCCAECGEPWQRLVEKEVKPHPNRWSKKADALQYSQSENDYAEGGTLGQSIETRTVGFSPSCACASAAPPVPGIVLDPFAGSGTTLCVALAHGRRAVGIELNEGYAAVARARCERAARLAGATTPSLFGEEPA